MGTATDRRSADSPPLHARLGDAANVLLLASPEDAADHSACTNLLTADATEPADVLVVALEETESATHRVVAWRRPAGMVPSTRTGLISVGESTHTSSESVPAAPDSRDHLHDLADLTELGVTISDRLETRADPATPTVVCFDSLTTLLDHVDLDQVFRFLHVLAGRVEATGGVAHYHMDPTAHHDRAIHTLSRLVDATVTVDESGEWTFATR